MMGRSIDLGRMQFVPAWEVQNRIADEVIAGGPDTLLFVEHDMEVVERYAQRVVAFYDGRVIADGPPETVLSDPDVRTYVVGPELHRRL